MELWEQQPGLRLLIHARVQEMPQAQGMNM